MLRTPLLRRVIRRSTRLRFLSSVAPPPPPPPVPVGAWGRRRLRFAMQALQHDARCREVAFREEHVTDTLYAKVVASLRREMGANEAAAKAALADAATLLVQEPSISIEARGVALEYDSDDRDINAVRMLSNNEQFTMPWLTAVCDEADRVAADAASLQSRYGSSEPNPFTPVRGPEDEAWRSRRFDLHGRRRVAKYTQLAMERWGGSDIGIGLSVSAASDAAGEACDAAPSLVSPATESSNISHNSSVFIPFQVAGSQHFAPGDPRESEDAHTSKEKIEQSDGDKTEEVRAASDLPTARSGVECKEAARESATSLEYSVAAAEAYSRAMAAELEAPEVELLEAERKQREAAEEAELERLTLAAAQREAEVARLLYPLFVAHLRADCARAHAHRHQPSLEDSKPRGAPRSRSWCGSAFGAEVEKQRKLAAFADLQRPQEWYPAARLMKRKIIYHGGPTNSGKTYHALQALRNAKRSPFGGAGATDNPHASPLRVGHESGTHYEGTMRSGAAVVPPESGVAMAASSSGALSGEPVGGIFCGPLRLLALEVYEDMNARGVYCSLLTGQERKEVPFADHISCTIEMVNVNRAYDVAVIDEIQMIGSPQRGHAWTRALLGLQAREIHVCGSLEAEALVRRLCERCGDDFELRTYERMSGLKVVDEPLESYENVRAGDCVVAFSRKDIFSIREAIERLTAHKCCVVYGQLPPETRAKQASLFNAEDSGYDVLVASDAIGMGLNLNIRRVVFHSTDKVQDTKAKQKGKVPVTMMKQIAGRAGRRSSQYKDQGEVTCLKGGEDMEWLRASLAAPVEQVEAAGLFPAVEHLQAYSALLDQLDEDEERYATTTASLPLMAHKGPSQRGSSSRHHDHHSGAFKSGEGNLKANINPIGIEDVGRAYDAGSFSSDHITHIDNDEEEEVEGYGEEEEKYDYDELKGNGAPSFEHIQGSGRTIYANEYLDTAPQNKFLDLERHTRKHRRLADILASFMKTSRMPGHEEEGGKGGKTGGIVNFFVGKSKNGRAISSTLTTRVVEFNEDNSREDYFLCRHDEIATLANRLHDVTGHMPIEEAFTFAMAPVRISDPLSLSMLIKFAEAWAQGRPTSINVRFGHKPPSNVLELTDLCTRHNIIDLYLWLSNRFPGNFVERELALRQKDHAILLIQKGLKYLELSTDEIEKMGKHRPYSSSSRGTSKKKNEKDGKAAMKNSHSRARMAYKARER